MNDWQIARQLEYLVENLIWDDGSGEPLVRKAIAIPLDDEGLLKDQPAPVCLIRVGSATITPHRTDEIVQTINLTLIMGSDGDKIGRSMLLGKDRGDGARGKGLYEAEEILLGGISSLTEQDGIRHSEVHTSDPEAFLIGQENIVVARSYGFSANGTRQRTYNPPTRLRGTPAVGSVSLVWTLPADRFDRKRVRLRRHTSKVTSISDGVEITLSGDLATSVVDTVAAGTYYYGIFGEYDEYGTGVPADYEISRPVNLKVTVT